MDRNETLIKLLQNAELKARMSLYYLQQNNGYNMKVPEDPKIKEVNDLYQSSQIYCKQLEKQLKEKKVELSEEKKRSAETHRHNEAMLEELDILTSKLEKYPKMNQQLRAEIDKLTNKVSQLEEQKKYMEQQATQNEGKVQQYQSLQQDLASSQSYIARLQKYLTGSSAAKQPVLMLDKECGDVTPRDTTLRQSHQELEKHHITIKSMRSDLVQLRENFTAGSSAIQGDMVKLKEMMCGGLLSNGHAAEEKPRPTSCKSAVLSTELLMNVERVEMVCRILPPDTSDQHFIAYSSNTKNTSVILKDNNTVTTYTLDMVIPINASQNQVLRHGTRSCQLLSNGRSSLIVMLGDSNLTLYGTPDSQGLLSTLLSQLLLLKDEEDSLTVSVGAFFNNQLCDGLSEFSTGDGNVTAIPVTSHEQGSQLLSQADIPDGVDHVLHRFVFTATDLSRCTIALLEAKSLDSDSCDLLRDYRSTGKGHTNSKPNVVYDTVNDFAEKGAAVTVYFNIKPDLQSLNDSVRMLSAATKVTGIEPVVQKKRGIFSFR